MSLEQALAQALEATQAVRTYLDGGEGDGKVLVKNMFAADKQLKEILSHQKETP